MFEAEFRSLSGQEDDHWPSSIFRDKYLRWLLQDTAGFGRARMMCRVLGMAHGADLETIFDPGQRAVAESRALNIGQTWIINRHQVNQVDDLIQMVTEASPAYPFGG